jgi:hypothetical protein
MAAAGGPEKSFESILLEKKINLEEVNYVIIFAHGEISNSAFSINNGTEIISFIEKGDGFLNSGSDISLDHSKNTKLNKLLTELIENNYIKEADIDEITQKKCYSTVDIFKSMIIRFLLENKKLINIDNENKSVLTQIGLDKLIEYSYNNLFNKKNDIILETYGESCFVNNMDLTFNDNRPCINDRLSITFISNNNFVKINNKEINEVLDSYEIKLDKLIKLLGNKKYILLTCKSYSLDFIYNDFNTYAISKYEDENKKFRFFSNKQFYNIINLPKLNSLIDGYVSTIDAFSKKKKEQYITILECNEENLKTKCKEELYEHFSDFIISKGDYDEYLDKLKYLGDEDEDNDECKIVKINFRPHKEIKMSPTFFSLKYYKYKHKYLKLKKYWAQYQKSL